MPYAYTSWWAIDDGSCEQEAGVKLLCQPGLTVVGQEYEHENGKMRIKVIYSENKQTMRELTFDERHQAEELFHQYGEKIDGIGFGGSPESRLAMSGFIQALEQIIK
jgi:hypothetical protein